MPRCSNLTSNCTKLKQKNGAHDCIRTYVRTYERIYVRDGGDDDDDQAKKERSVTTRTQLLLFFFFFSPFKSERKQAAN